MISLIESGDGSKTVIVRRCRWCERRTANKAARFFVNGEWQIIFDPMRYFGDDAKFSDGICPECKVEMRNKLNYD